MVPQCPSNSLYSAPVDEYDFLLNIVQILFGAVREVDLNLMAVRVIDQDTEGQKCTWSSAFHKHHSAGLQIHQQESFNIHSMPLLI